MVEKNWGEPRNPPEHPKRPGSEVPPRPPSCLPATAHPTAPMTEESAQHDGPGRIDNRGSCKHRGSYRADCRGTCMHDGDHRGRCRGKTRGTARGAIPRARAAHGERREPTRPVPVRVPPRQRTRPAAETRPDVPSAVPAQDTTKGRFRHESAPKAPAGPGPRRALRARLHLVREPSPHSRGEPQHRPGTVLRVAHENHARSATDFDAVTAAVAGVTGRPPAWLYVVFHCSAAFKMRSRDASRDSASPRTRLNATLCLRTSDRFSVV